MELEWYQIIEKVTWNDAKDFLDQIKDCDWRFPTVNELVALFDYRTGKVQKRHKSMQGKIFWARSVPDFFKIGKPTDAWAISMEFGWVCREPKGREFNVRYVRTIDSASESKRILRTRVVQDCQDGELRLGKQDS